MCIRDRSSNAPFKYKIKHPGSAHHDIQSFTFLIQIVRYILVKNRCGDDSLKKNKDVSRIWIRDIQEYVVVVGGVSCGRPLASTVGAGSL